MFLVLWELTLKNCARMSFTKSLLQEQEKYQAITWSNVDLELYCHMAVLNKQWVNSLWPSDVIWPQGSRSTLAQVMACCLMAPSHYLNQCWLIIRKLQWHSFLQEKPPSSVTEISLKITYLKFCSNHPGTNELNPIQFIGPVDWLIFIPDAQWHWLTIIHPYWSSWLTCFFCPGSRDDPLGQHLVSSVVIKIMEKLPIRILHSSNGRLCILQVESFAIWQKLKIKINWKLFRTYNNIAHIYEQHI